MNNFEKIKSITDIKEMEEFLKHSFDDVIEQFGCGSCSNYDTHHYPKSCNDCYWLPIGTSIEQWLQSEVEEI